MNQFVTLRINHPYYTIDQQDFYFYVKKAVAAWEDNLCSINPYWEKKVLGLKGVLDDLFHKYSNNGDKIRSREQVINGLNNKLMAQIERNQRWEGKLNNGYEIRVIEEEIERMNKEIKECVGKNEALEIKINEIKREVVNLLECAENTYSNSVMLNIANIIDVSKIKTKDSWGLHISTNKGYYNIQTEDNKTTEKVLSLFQDNKMDELCAKPIECINYGYYESAYTENGFYSKLVHGIEI